MSLPLSEAKAEKRVETIILNPVLPGFHPDPSILRVADDYYIATSTFEWYPGVRIHHSKDLKHWRLCTHALTRRSQLDMTGNPDSGGIWAPCLSFNNGIYYLIYTDVKTRWGNFKDTPNYLVTADRIEGPWSDPVYLNSSGFDPSLFHDDDGRHWLVNMLWDFRLGHNRFAGIVLQEYSTHEKHLVGRQKIIFRGTSLGWTEGPHLYKRNGWYYLMTAEGGTGYGHAVTMARAKSITGPFETDPMNPVVTPAHEPSWPLQKAGHGSLVETQHGEWALVHLVGRPTADRFCTLGRETAIQRVFWTDDGWLRLESGGRLPQLEIRKFDLPETPWPSEPTFDTFDAPILGSNWATLREAPDPSWCSLIERPGYLRLRGRQSLSSFYRQSMVARRVTEFHCQAETEVEFKPENFQQMAGLILYYDTIDFVYLRITFDENYGKRVGLVRSCSAEWQEFPESEQSLSDALPCRLKVVIDGPDAKFFYAVGKDAWRPVGPPVSILHMSDEGPKGFRFTGMFVGICAQDLSGSHCIADFSGFKLESASHT